jgi:predicted transcriptional regulator
MLEQLADGPMNISALAEALGLSSAIMTRHAAMLEEAGFIKTEHVSGRRGLKKVCALALKEAILTFGSPEAWSDQRLLSIPVGRYSVHSVMPSCGLAGPEGLIGQMDDPRYFSHPDRSDACLLWFRTGYVQYALPAFLFSPRVKQVEISMEICSEYPGYLEQWPSDIHFYLAGVSLGHWTSPGDFGAQRGIHTPQWWNLGTQHGLLKTLRITSESTFLDGEFLSDTGLRSIILSYQEDIPFRIAVHPNGTPGGLNLFGKGFGNYDQDILIRVYE